MQNNSPHFRAIYIYNKSKKICMGRKSIKFRILVPSEEQESTTGEELQGGSTLKGT